MADQRHSNRFHLWILGIVLMVYALVLWIMATIHITNTRNDILEQCKPPSAATTSLPAYADRAEIEAAVMNAVCPTSQHVQECREWCKRVDCKE